MHGHLNVSIKAFVRAMDAAGVSQGRKWLANYDRPGPEGRRHPGGDSLGTLYNRLHNIDELVWLCQHFGVEDTTIGQAREFAREGTSVQRQGKLFRASIPWNKVAYGAQAFIDKHSV